jgi:hypothetical protein
MRRTWLPLWVALGGIALFALGFWARRHYVDYPEQHCQDAPGLPFWGLAAVWTGPAVLLVGVSWLPVRLTLRGRSPLVTVPVTLVLGVLLVPMLPLAYLFSFDAGPMANFCFG